ncbi:MAG: short-subunit dehydrogenase [Candidatus Nanohaloarchaea archaeon]|jgi:short-subunit dehydrogenase
MNILITGGANGIGKRTALKLVQRGHNVKVIDTDKDALKDLDQEIETFHGDVREKEDLQEATRRFEVEVLINSAGYQKQGSVEDMEIDNFREHIETNYLGTVNAVKTCLTSIRRSKGRVINMSSVAGKTGLRYLSAYCGSKHAVEGFSDSLRMELKDSEVKVVIVEPGPIKTGFNEQGRDHLRNFVPGSRYSDEYSKKLDSPVEGVKTEKAAEKVVKAVEAEKPKTRYTVTKEAFFVRKLKRFFPDRLWDKLMVSQQ